MSGGALDTSVTLDEVFAVVGARRVPLAPELAGYLVLEVAEHANPAGGDVDPRGIFVGDEGTVALVKPKRGAATGDAEASIRAALARLLEASGSQTPALAAASRRKAGGGLPALAEELEAALIPVNRAAGRRALARLAREVKRVTLGVGRNALPSVGEASPASRRASSPALASGRPPEVAEAAPVAAPFPVPTPPPPKAPTPEPPRAQAPSFTREEEPTTARGQIPAEILKKATPEPSDASELPTMQFEPQGRGPSPSQADVDSLIDTFGVSGSGDQQHARALKAIAGLEPTPLPPNAGIFEPPAPPPQPEPPFEPRGPSESQHELDDLLAIGADTPAKAVSERPPPRVPSAPPPSARPRMPSLSNERQLPTQPSKVRQAQVSLASIHTRPPARRSIVPWIIALVAVVAGGFAVARLRPDLSAAPGPAAQSAPVASATQVTMPCLDTLVVTDVPAHAEVLVRKGQAPVDVERMPVGARLEFVATAEGFAPKRVVVPSGAAWDVGADGKPRFEAAVQLDKSKAPHGGDPWPAGDPGSEVGGQGPPGTVHVVATPRGAEIWMLAGLGPEAHIEQQLMCDEDVDLLLAGPTTFRKRLHVPASAFVAEQPKPGSPPSKLGAKRTATVSAGAADK